MGRWHRLVAVWLMDDAGAYLQPEAREHSGEGVRRGRKEMLHLHVGFQMTGVEP
jgi:hypothetical protein